jgi:hypothetical protein
MSSQSSSSSLSSSSSSSLSLGAPPSSLFPFPTASRTGGKKRKYQKRSAKERKSSKPRKSNKSSDSVRILPEGFSLKKSKKSKQRDTGKHAPPSLVPGSLVQLKPCSSLVLVVSVDSEQDIIIVVDVGTCNITAHRAVAFCCVTKRYFERFVSSGLMQCPPENKHPSTWTWSYVVNERDQTHVAYCDQSRDILTRAFGSRETHSVYLPIERHSVMLLCIFNFFAVNDPGLDEKYFKYRVVLSY